MKTTLRLRLTAAACTAALAATIAPAEAQRGRGVPPPVGRQNGPFDPSGYWVALVTEDWRFRMVTPPKGDYESVPLNAAGRKIADAWNPANDEASGESCKAYGAPGVMRIPGRLRVQWEDDTTLRIDTDAGQQSRIFRFQSPRGDDARPAEGRRQWQGSTVATWERGAIKAVTINLRPGYLRQNGVPYSENTVLTEYLDKATMGDGTEYLIVSTVVHDPAFLTQDFITSTHFRKEPDGAKWNPTPCTSR